MKIGTFGRRGFERRWIIPSGLKGGVIVNWTTIFRHCFASIALIAGLLLIPGTGHAESMRSPTIPGMAPFVTASFNLAQAFEPPSGSGAPVQTTGGGRRDGGKCRTIQTLETLQTLEPSVANQYSLEKLLVALIPPNNWGLTFADRPTFFFYIPKTSAKAVEFVLEDDDLNRVATINRSVKETPTIVSLTPDETTPTLATGQEYQWALSLVCGAEGELRDPLVTGRVRRIQPDPALASKLQTATQVEQVKLYAASGIWYEAVTTLARLQRTQPNDPRLASSWTELLRSVGLEAIAATPLKP